MNPKVLLAIGAVALVGVGAFSFWLGRQATSSGAEAPAPLPMSKPAEAPIDVEPALKPGARVEALSAEGWQSATIQEISGDQALIRYERPALGEERVDVRLLRKPEAELTSAPAPARSPVTPPAVTPPPNVTPPPPPLGGRPATGSVAIGAYACELDTEGLSIEGAPPEDAQFSFSVNLEITSEGGYRAFGDNDGEYSYDAASGRIDWESGVLAAEDSPTGKYDPATQTLVTTMGGQALTCQRR